MTQQKALFLQTPVNGEWVVSTRDIPKAGPGELVVKIHATALNPIDWRIRAYDIIIKEYPVILGYDSAGTVEEVGEGVKGFAKGDRVLHEGHFENDKASFQQYTIVPAEITAKLPSNLSFDQGASIPLALTTAVVGLYGNRSQPGVKKLTPPWEEGGKGLYSGPIVVFGGSTSVGQYVIQLARLSGFSPIISTASLHNTALLKELGVAHVVDRHADVPAEAARLLSTPVKLAFDAISEAATQAQAWETLSSGGTLVVLAPASSVDKAKYPEKTAVDGIFGSVHIPQERALGVSLYAKLTELLRDGSIQPNRIEVLPNGLAGIPDGLERLRENKVSGIKLIARPLETA